MGILSNTVANLINFRYQAKQAHWSAKGILFYEYHLLFDRIYNEYEEIIDKLAERAISLEGSVAGTITKAANDSELEELPEVVSALEFAKALLNRLEFLKVSNNLNIGRLLGGQ